MKKIHNYQTNTIIFFKQIVKISLYLVALTLVFSVITTFIYTISSVSKFSMYNDSNQWFFTYNFNNMQSITSIVPFSILQGLTHHEINPKIALITYNIIKAIPLQLLLLTSIGISQNIINELLSEKAFFSIKHVKKIKLIAWFIIIYYTLSDFILNIGFIIISDVFLIQFNNIHISGLLFGGLVYLIAEIFNYGTFLQFEYERQVE